MNQRSALSALAAFAASVAPFCLASFELTIPSDVFATIVGMAVLGVFERSTTVYGPAAETVTPPSRNDGFPFRLIRRRNEKTTSADVIGVPSAKRMFRRSWNVNVFASLDARYPVAAIGRGRDTSLPRNVSSVS